MYQKHTSLSSFLLFRPYLLITLTKRHKVHHYQSPGLLYGGGFQKCLVCEYVGTAKNCFQYISTTKLVLIPLSVMSQLRPGLASNVNFAHWTLDNGRVRVRRLIWTQVRHREEHFESSSGLSCLFSPPIRLHIGRIGRIGGGFRDDHKRQTGTQGWECLTVNNKRPAGNL